jgi:hypothetical protein
MRKIGKSMIQNNARISNMALNMGNLVKKV